MALVIEIREESLSFVHTKTRVGGQVDVINHFRIEIPTGDKNEMLHYTDPIVTDLIKHEFEQRNIVERYATFVLNNKQGISKELDVPQMDRKRMLNIIKNELRMKLNLTGDYVVDFMKLDSFTKGDTPFERVMAVAVRFNDIKELETWSLSFDIKIKSIVTGPTAMISLLSERTVVLGDKPLLIGDFYREFTRFYLFMDEKFVALRTIYKTNFQDSDDVTRVEQLIKLMSAAVLEENGTQIEKVIMMGELERLDLLKARFDQNLTLSNEFFDYEKVILPCQKSILEHMNGIGAIL
ncbi:hypothetical protein ERUR111494_01125 [Erysipelothrix urinaevulpis]|uniref:hypothetical protein n=1 Tax=Erysipelothrix urinaevulpis TaxID=2683717 RepID=UPI0013592BB2|nr:hypothetical protein [Erysipelothrix urinaevulpis]